MTLVNSIYFLLLRTAYLHELLYKVFGFSCKYCTGAPLGMFYSVNSKMYYNSYNLLIIICKYKHWLPNAVAYYCVH